MPTTLQSTGVLYPDNSLQSGAAYDIFRTSQTFLSSGNWTCPAGITLIQLSMIGGGGAGGQGTQGVVSNTTFYSGGGGGGSGAVIWNYRVAVTPGTVYVVTVGASTLATSFGALMTVNPGISGTNGTGGTAGGTGGLGGAAFNFGATPTTVVARTGLALAPISIAGGKGSNGARTTASTNIGGKGGDTPLPIGEYAGATGDAVAGTPNTGAGGSGGRSGQAGAAGGSGLVVIQW